MALGAKLVLVVLDNHGFGCINRLQQACGGAPFNNLLGETPAIDFAAHARSLGARAEAVKSIADLEAALERAKASELFAAILKDARLAPKHFRRSQREWIELAEREK